MALLQDVRLSASSFYSSLSTLRYEFACVGEIAFLGSRYTVNPTKKSEFEDLRLACCKFIEYLNHILSWNMVVYDKFGQLVFDDFLCRRFIIRTVEELNGRLSRIRPSFGE